MMSNLLFASRAVLSKKAMSGLDQGENMDSANTFAVVTMMASIIATPIALALEHKKILPAWQAAITIPGESSKTPISLANPPQSQTHARILQPPGSRALTSARFPGG